MNIQKVYLIGKFGAVPSLEERLTMARKSRNKPQDKKSYVWGRRTEQEYIKFLKDEF